MKGKVINRLKSNNICYIDISPTLILNVRNDLLLISFMCGLHGSRHAVEINRG